MQTLKQLKEQFISDSESFIIEIKKLKVLNGSQLNWKYSPERWSIAECLDHLAVTNNLYLKGILNQVTEKQVICDDSTELVRHRLFGKLIIKAVDPYNSKKTKTFKVFYPASSNYDSTVIENLIQVQKELINFVAGSVNLNFNKYSLTSPASRFIHENFCDVLEIIRLHNQRHLHQINEIISSDKFPVM